jgi:hypothetical protein
MENEILFLQQNISTHKQQLYKLEEALTIKTEAYKSFINSKKLQENMLKEQKAKAQILNEVKQENIAAYKKKKGINMVEEATEEAEVAVEEAEVAVEEAEVAVEEAEVAVEEATEEAEVAVEEVEVAVEEATEEAEVAVEEVEVAVEEVEVDDDGTITLNVEEITLEEDIKQLEKTKSKRGRKKKEKELSF